MFLITEYRAHYQQPVSHENMKPFAEAGPAEPGPISAISVLSRLPNGAFLLLTKKNVLKVNLFMPAPFRQLFQ